MRTLNVHILLYRLQISGIAGTSRLDTWMKDYVFYPVTLSRWMSKFGKKCKKVFGKKIGRAIPIGVANLIVFFLVGIWHGAAWKYIVYGMYNGVIIAFSGIMADNYRSWKKETEYFR